MFIFHQFSLIKTADRLDNWNYFSDNICICNKVHLNLFQLLTEKWNKILLVNKWFDKFLNKIKYFKKEIRPNKNCTRQ